ncbi:hypothetical protein SDC9_116114 [bioreactor metagenome]|uniref:Uncharacterized protein n=1 Tax=bioreactor metagenome TaxID=1076179 RepID=A0A645BUP5_9ZZZZ
MEGQLVAVRQLHQFAQVHDADAAGNMLHHAQIMGNKEIGQAHALLKLLEHIDHLGLNGYVQGGDGLVADDELGVYGQGAGDAHPLALAPGKFMGIAVGVLSVEPNEIKQLHDAVPALLGILRQMVDIDGLAHDIAHRHAGVQAGVGILEHDLHLPPVRKHVHMGDVFPVVKNLAAGGFVEAQQGAARGGLAAAGFSHEAQGLALIDIEGHVVNSLDDPFLKQPSAAHGEKLLQMLYFNQFFIFHHARASPWLSNLALSSSQHAL